MKPKEQFAANMRNFVFGAEDSLVSTVGFLSGIAVAEVSGSTIVLTGTVLIFVEAFSMGVGSLLSEHSSREFMEEQELPISHSLGSAVIMFVSYLVAGFLVLLPYIAIDPDLAFWVSIGLALVLLFVLGAIAARVYRIRIWKHAAQMLLIGGIAVVIGAVVGNLVKGL